MILRIKVSLIAVISYFLAYQAHTQPIDSLKMADSLFSENQYTQAFPIYESFFNSGKVSSAMLLKMAFIQEGSGNYDEALFYLDTYYTRSADREVIPKIQELANEHGLQGYEYDDEYYFAILLNKYKSNLAYGVTFLTLIFVLFSYLKIRNGERPYFTAFIQVFLIICLFALVNFNSSHQGLIVSDQTLLRSGPSAGADPVQIIEKGHKVIVLQESEVWIKVLWQGDEVFVRRDRIRPI